MGIAAKRTSKTCSMQEVIEPAVVVCCQQAVLRRSSSEEGQLFPEQRSRGIGGKKEIELILL